MTQSRIVINVLISCVMATSLSGCFFDRSGLPIPATLRVEPALFCPGDPVEIAWDATGLPRRVLFCAEMGRDFREPVACTSDSACPGGSSGSVCVDGYCCPRDIYVGNRPACPTAAGCYPPFELTVTGNPEAIDPPIRETRALRANRTVFPSETTAYTLSLSNALSEDPYQDTRVATMVTENPPTATDFHVGFVCEGGTAGYSTITLNETNVSEHVRVASVRNTSRHAIRVEGGTPTRGPVTLRPGESTDALAGAPRGSWSVTLAPFDPAALRVPRCEGTNIRDPWPDLQVQFTWICAIDPEK